jgi:hypothetical protein
MTYSTPFKLALVFCVLVGIGVIGGGPFPSPAMAQRRDNDDERRPEGDRRGGNPEGGENRDFRRGRGRWGRPREGDNNNEERRGRERPRDENDSESRDDEERSPRMDVSGYARDLVKQYDKNGDMMLQEDERGQLRGPAARADLNEDKTITVEEIVASLTNRESAERGGRSRRPERENRDGSSERSSNGNSAAAAKTRVYTSLAAGSGSATEADKRRSYRFTPATERLTGNLPSWFKSRDRNKDGQVSMSEYSRTWSERMVREFQRVDRNGDGVVTPKEAGE